MIRLIDVEKFYESGAGKTWVLRRINLEIREGDFITVMGPSGAGKSTLMGIIGMLDGAWKGEYHLFDNAVHKLDNRRRVELHKKYIGFVFQQYHLLDNLTVAENLDLPLSYRDIKKVEREGMVADILDRFQIVGKKSLFPNQLSGGQQQIVAVAASYCSKDLSISFATLYDSRSASIGYKYMQTISKCRLKKASFQ